MIRLPLQKPELDKLPGREPQSDDNPDGQGRWPHDAGSHASIDASARSAAQASGPFPAAEPRARSSSFLGRRRFAQSLAGLALGHAATACTLAPVVAASSACRRSQPDKNRGSSGPGTATTSGIPLRTIGRSCNLELWSWFDLSADDPRSAELSAAAWEERTRTLWCIQDETADIVGLTPDAELRTWKFGDVVHPRVGGLPLDAEGLVVTDDGFILCSEIGPRIIELDRNGNYRRDLPLPPKFSEARENKSFESLTLSPDGRYLFTTSETALPRDDGRSTPTTGAHVRILRIDRATGEAVERAYATDRMPQCADYGVADLTSLRGDDLLVLERGWTKGYGNVVRIYRVDFGDESAACQTVESLGENSHVLRKGLLLDLSVLPVNEARLPPPKQAEPSPLMDNFEGMGIGPVLPDGRPSLILVSDDNNRNDQVARVVVLAVNWGP